MTKLLNQAQQALNRRDWRGALTLALRSMREKRTARAIEIICKAHCGRHDLRLIQAYIQNLSASAKRRVRRYCKAQNYPLPGL